ncbi:MAG: FecR family protein [Candidatus Riflebacteria bacterium]|nr:FecR family protein [Candidatus Riflebacteria bacterium]
MNRKIRVFASFCLMIGSCLVIGCGSDSAPIGKLAGVQGQVTIKPGQAETFTGAAVEQKLFSGDSIKTADTAKAEIQLTGDDSRIVLSSNTYLEIRNYSEKDLRQMHGIAIYKISPQNRELKIQTPQGMATVLGTVLRIDASDTETIVTVEKGKVGFSKKAGHQIFIETGKQYSTSTPEDAAVSIDPLELEKLFSNETLNPIINPR